jgi:hypothetical protein
MVIRLAEATDEIRSPPKQPPEGKGGSKELAVVEAVDHAKGIWDGDSQPLTKGIQILFLCPGPACARLWFSLPLRSASCGPLA